MKGLFVLLLAVCTLAAAMVPRHRRAVNTGEMLKSQTTKALCDTKIPCGWNIYDPKNIHVQIRNSQCICADDDECQVDEEDISSSTLVLRCQPAKRL